MRIAFLSFEFPPDTAFGGIATYTLQMALSLKSLGCDVEVFASSAERETVNETYQGLTVHRVRTAEREDFRKTVIPVLTQRHAHKNFDLIEAPEYGAEGLYVKDALPSVPLVVKFHTPSFLVRQLNCSLKAHRLKYKLKDRLGLGRYKKEGDPEYQTALRADALAAPSQSMAEIVGSRWSLQNISVIPWPFMLPETLLSIPVETATNTVTYLGRLEARKGVHLLAKAVPVVLDRYPQARFRFIGKTNVGPQGRGTMLAYLQETLRPWLDRIEFIDQVPPHEVAAWLGKTDVCVFPSLWEAYGYVCIEAMCAARGIVASKFGGMHDMLNDIDERLLVDPADTSVLAAALIDLLEHPAKRMEWGKRCREKVESYYAKEMPQAALDFYRDVAKRFAKRLP